MTLSDSPRALGGGPLAEGNLVRLIYTDEAGTSANEPVRVVASVIVHGDQEYATLGNEMRRLVREQVPSKLQPGFVIHAKEIFNGGKRVPRNSWDFEDRLAFLKEVVALPRLHGVPVAVGTLFRGVVPSVPVGSKFKLSQYEHLLAFAKCMERADYFLRKYLGGSEIGTVVCEDVPEMRKILAKFGLFFRELPMTVSAKGLRQSIADKTLMRRPREQTFKIDHIIDVPHFVEKDGAPLLQLADACAFSFRRCLAKQDRGDELVKAMLGENNPVSIDPVWYSGGSSGVFCTSKYWTDEERQAEASLRTLVQIVSLFQGNTQ